MSDTPIARVTIDQMTDAEIDAHLEVIRERRLMAWHIYVQHKEEETELKKTKLTTRLTKQLAMFDKEHTRALAAIDKIEKRALAIRAMRLEMGDL